MYGNVRSSDTSDTTSPIDPSLDYSAPTSGSTPGNIRKSKRTGSVSSTKNPARLVRQSPVTKPQSRRKQPSSTVIPPKEIVGLLEEAQRPRNPSSAIINGKLPIPYAQDSSGPDSVSPEPLSEILMPPPATPKSTSASKSPFLPASQVVQHQKNNAIASTNKDSPATPASLMKIRKQAGRGSASSRTTSQLREQAAMAEADMEQIMEEIALPDAVESSNKPSLKPISTEDANRAKATPRSVGSKTPTTASAPSKATTSAFPSPTASAFASPSGLGSGKLNDQAKLKIRDAKKRTSSSTQISPALRPKISPSIKPLLPEGGKYSSPLSNPNCIAKMPTSYCLA